MPSPDGSIGRWKEDQLIRRSTFDFEWNEERERRMLVPKLSPRNRKSLCEMGETWDEGKGRPLFALSLLARRRRHRTRRGGRSPLPPLPNTHFRPGGETVELPSTPGAKYARCSLQLYDRNVEPHHNMSIA